MDLLELLPELPVTCGRRHTSQDVLLGAWALRGVSRPVY
jgi:hypothetical protein